MAAPVVLYLLKYMATKPIKTLLKKGMNPKTGIRYGKRKFNTRSDVSEEYTDVNSRLLTNTMDRKNSYQKSLTKKMYNIKVDKTTKQVIETPKKHNKYSLDYFNKQGFPTKLPKGQTMYDPKIEREFKQSLIKKTKGNISTNKLNKKFNEYMGYE